MAGCLQTDACSAFLAGMVKWLIRWTSQVSACPWGEVCCAPASHESFGRGGFEAATISLWDGYEMGLLEPILLDFAQWLPPTEKHEKLKKTRNFENGN